MTVNFYEVWERREMVWCIRLAADQTENAKKKIICEEYDAYLHTVILPEGYGAVRTEDGGMAIASKNERFGFFIADYNSKNGIYGLFCEDKGSEFKPFPLKEVNK